CAAGNYYGSCAYW
nr:immunoglobulin heavy chain junction region [Mus musculus]